MSDLSMPDWLARRASVSGDRPALLAPETRLTFAELDAAAWSTADWLSDLGVGAGDRVAFLLGNGVPLVSLVHAAPRLGITLVPLNVRLTPAEVAWQLRDVGARLLLHDEPNAALARDAAAEVPATSVKQIERAESHGPTSARAPAARAAPNIDLGAVATVVYTSGTTGRPKGAMLTFGNHWWSAVGSALNLGIREDDRWLVVLPLFHVGGLSILVRSVTYGIAAVVQPRFDPAEANRAIDEEGVTIVSVVSSMLQQMLDERGQRPYPPSLRCVLLGGGPAPRPLLEDAAERGVPVVQTYGLTETASQVATLAPADALRRLGSAGKPLLPMELRIVRADNGGCAETGEIGEIAVRGPSVTVGYVHRPDATAAAIRDGWLHTGDLGYLDRDGHLYVVDRRDDLIISGGENVYPAEVEAVLLAHPRIVEAGVRGVADARWGQRVVAVVVAAAGTNISAEDVLAFCRERLAGYKVPVLVRFTDSLPRNAAGKLLRRELTV